MVNSPHVHLQLGPVSTLTLEDDKGLNLLSVEMGQALYQHLQQLQQDPQLKVLILTGAGSKAFCAGADMRQLLSLSDIPHYVEQGQQLTQALENFPVPVIAAVNGYALGAGFSLALACDLRILSTRARMGQLAVRNGLVPPFGNIQRLIEIIGASRARELIFTGRTLPAETALQVGLTHQLVAPDELLPAAQALAQEIATSPTFAIRQAKQVIERTLSEGHAVGYALQEDALIACLDHPDSRRIMQGFLESSV